VLPARLNTTSDGCTANANEDASVGFGTAVNRAISFFSSSVTHAVPFDEIALPEQAAWRELAAMATGRGRSPVSW
jgi:hypothetical protein